MKLCSRIPLFLPWLIIGGLLTIMGTETLCFGEFYKYVDKDGKVRFVDDLSKIPEEYLQDDKIKTYKEQRDFMTPEQVDALRQQQGGRAENQNETPVSIVGNRILVRVKIGANGQEVSTVLVLDTGASITALHDSVIKKLPVRKFFSGKARVASGQVIDSKITKLDYIQVGPKIQRDIYTGVIDYSGPMEGHYGLLGLNFLKHFKHEIDYKRQVIRWLK